MANMALVYIDPRVAERIIGLPLLNAKADIVMEKYGYKKGVGKVED